MMLPLSLWLALSSSPVVAGDGLDGTDSIPAATAVDGLSVEGLMAVANDDGQPVFRRARAIRLLGARPPRSDDGVDALLGALSSSTHGILAGQVLTARAHRAWQGGTTDDDRLARLMPVVTAALQSLDPAVASAAAFALWLEGSPASMATLAAVAAEHRDPSVRATARGRLQWPRRAGQWRSASVGVLHPPDGGPSPPSRWQLQRPEHLPDPR